MIQGAITTSDGAELYVRAWEPAAPAAANVVILHGLGDHGGRYEGIARAFVAAGLRSHAFDLRGFGLSSGKRAAVTRWARFLDDVDEVVRDRTDDGLPLVLYGHSMGALIALTYAVSGKGRPDRLVLSAPALDADITAAKRLAARVIGRLAPRFSLPNDITAEQLASDPSVGEAYFADPLVLSRSTTGLGLAFLRAMGEARSSLQRLSVPTLVVHGGDDTLVPPAVSEPLGELANVERIVVPGCRHEWHNEPENGPRTLARVVDWVVAGL
jgi:alpha-beta hydrolase superfamily lysophospholipase